MKKRLGFTLLLCVLLSGCAVHKTPVPEETQASETVTSPAEATTAPGRPAKAELEFWVEGMPELCPMTLHVGNGYSIYIPDEGWKLEQERDDGLWTDAWESVYNDAVELEVKFFPGVTENDIKTAVSPAPITLSEGGFWVMYKQWEDDGRENCGDVRLYPAENGVYGVFLEYPMEAAEGFGTRMHTIANTFEITE